METLRAANGLSDNVSLGSYRLVVENVPELSFAPADTSTVVVRRFYSNDWDATYLSEFVAESKVRSICSHALRSRAQPA